MGYGEITVENMHNNNPAKISAGLASSFIKLGRQLIDYWKGFFLLSASGEWYFLFAQNSNKAVQNIVTNSKSFVCIKYKGLCIPI